VIGLVGATANGVLVAAIGTGRLLAASAGVAAPVVHRSSVPAGEARGWLSVAAAHTALNLIRSGRRRASREESAAAADDHVAPDVAEAVVTLEERRRVRAALARLPHKQAVALVLRHSGLSYAEVAAALDLSPGSVGTTVRRAELALRKELHDDAR